MPLSWWEELSEQSDQPEVQARIRRLIWAGRVRVLPVPGDPTRVRVVPLHSEEPRGRALMLDPTKTTTDRGTLVRGDSDAGSGDRARPPSSSTSGWNCTG